MSNQPAGAVFLSYASQDAGAAKRVCEALRAAKVEVWFDQSELRGGDSWDAKIRRQIKDCALFVPLISANTDARAEGYFRLEWKLAVDRSHLMSDDHPFLFPVVIDDTPDATARVPDKFREVQWTRLRLDETPSELAARVAKLLGGTSAGVPRAFPAGNDRGGARRTQAKSAWVRYAWVVVGLTFGLIYALRPLWRAESKRDQRVAAASPASAEAPPPPPPATPPLGTWPRDPELKRAIALIDSLDATLEDFRLADEITERAVARAPADPEVVTVRARVHSAFILRNFDFSEDRTLQAKRFGERAVQLSPDDPEALYALSIFLSDRADDSARAETLARHACELAPAEPRFWRQLMRTVSAQRPEEGLALGEEIIRRFPKDALAHYELVIVYRNKRDWVNFERETDATLALAPLANAINWKARAALLRGDMAEFRRWLDKVPARARAEERTVISAIIYAALTGESDYGLKSLQGFAEPWFYDANNYSGPAALPRAMLLQQAGKSGLARAQYEIAAADLARHRLEKPGDLTALNAEIWTFLGLGRLDEARALHRTAIEALRRPYRISAMTGWWFETIPRSLLLGDRTTALQLIREAAAEPEGRQTIRRRLQMDSRMGPFRDDPEITALLAEPTTKP
jgi:Flp pilus assembly protein TadD